MAQVATIKSSVPYSGQPGILQVSHESESASAMSAMAKVTRMFHMSKVSPQKWKHNEYVNSDIINSVIPVGPARIRVFSYDCIWFSYDFILFLHGFCMILYGFCMVCI